MEITCLRNKGSKQAWLSSIFSLSKLLSKVMPPDPITWALQILRSWFPRNENVYQGAYSIWSSDCNLAILDLDSLVAQRLKCLPAMRETWVRSLGWEDSLEKEMATPPTPPPSILAWRIPWMEEPGGLQSMGSQRVRHDWVTSLIQCHQNKNNNNKKETPYLLRWLILIMKGK